VARATTLDVGVDAVVLVASELPCCLWSSIASLRAGLLAARLKAVLEDCRTAD
jgi:hypothetical protein